MEILGYVTAFSTLLVGIATFRKLWYEGTKVKLENKATKLKMTNKKKRK